MADRIKGITVEIGGDTTGLSKALSKSTQSQLKDVNKLLKLDPTNTTLLAQKQKLLQQAVSETKEKLTQLKSVQDQMDAGLKHKRYEDDEIVRRHLYYSICRISLCQRTPDKDHCCAWCSTKKNGTGEILCCQLRRYKYLKYNEEEQIRDPVHGKRLDEPVSDPCDE